MLHKQEGIHDFSRKLILTSAFSVLLSSSITGGVQSAVAMFAPAFPAWVFTLLEAAIACVGLYWVSKNGKNSVKNKENKIKGAEKHGGNTDTDFTDESK